MTENDHLIAARPGLPRAISVAELAEAVHTSTSWRGVMRAFGLTTSRTGRVLRDLCDELAIDYAHFRQSRVDLRSVAAVVSSSATWEGVLEQLGYAPNSGSARATVRKHCRRLGVDVSQLVARRQPPLQWTALTPAAAHLRAAGPHFVAAALAVAGVPVSYAAEGLAYDLLADMGAGGISRIQVKTTTQRAGQTWECALTRKSYTATATGGHRKALYSAEDVDFFACVDPRGSVYLIPIAAVEGYTMISLRRYEQFRLPSPCGCGDVVGRADRI